MNKCKLIKRYKWELGVPEQLGGKCEGYAGSDGDEPCEKCKECKKLYGSGGAKKEYV